MTSLAELFPDGDFRFHLTLRRGEPQEFFRTSDPTGHVLSERKRWLADMPKRYSALTPEGSPLLGEFVDLCAEWGVLGGNSKLTANAVEKKADAEILHEVGSTLEPDVLLLSRDNDGQFCLRGGVLCFPTGWSLEEKMGKTLDSIHGVVPGLNPVLGSPISQFLSRLKPGVAFHRDNWGISPTDELNQHPARALPALELPVALDRLWLRVEHQVLLALPRSQGVVFGIRIANHRLDQLVTRADVSAGLIRSLETMPLAMAVYKRIAPIQLPLLEKLRGST
jgi:dimethylamine monooxygenase subunit A